MAKERPSSSKMRPTRTSKEDILMSIKPEHMSNIAAGRKNHEYRGYLLPSSVRRLWLYTTAPLSRIEYVARISRGKTRGEVAEDGGIGNADFNAGRKVSKYAYEIQELWKLREPISLASAISSGFLKGPPQKYCWAPVALLANYSLPRQDHLFCREVQENPVEGRDRSGPEMSGDTPSVVGRSKISDFFTPLGSDS
jgi:predicted transcriptional regulator